MISIKRFLEQRSGGASPKHDVLEAALQMCRLLLDGLATHTVHGRGADFQSFGRTLKELAQRMNDPPSALDLLEISSDAVEALEAYSQRTTEYLREENEQLQSMVSMLTDTVADLSGQTDASVGRLQAIERQIEHASGLDDIRLLGAALGSCLAAVREAAAQQRSGSAGTVQRLQDQINFTNEQIAGHHPNPRPGEGEIDLIPELSDALPSATATRYVAVFKLQRAEHIATRFGESARQQMLSLISQSLKGVLGPEDRLLRWKGTSFVMFLNSMGAIQQVRARLSEAVANTGQYFIEVGKKSALLSVGVDWIVFPEAQCGSLDAVFAEVDSFLANTRPGVTVQAE